MSSLLVVQCPLSLNKLLLGAYCLLSTELGFGNPGMYKTDKILDLVGQTFELGKQVTGDE